MLIEQRGKSVSLFGPTHLLNLLKITTLHVYLALLVYLAPESSFYPSELIYFAFFNMRHPVLSIASMDLLNVSYLSDLLGPSELPELLDYQTSWITRPPGLPDVLEFLEHLELPESPEHPGIPEPPGSFELLEHPALFYQYLTSY